MILSPYHNPPYRTPTPKASSASPPPLGHSPKRKRKGSNDSLRVSTDVQVNSKESAAGPNSPRTKVAEKLQDLNIRQPSKQVRSKDTGAVPRKRIKRAPTSADDRVSSDIYVAATPEQDRKSATKDATVSLGEIAETPDCGNRPDSPPRDSSGIWESMQRFSEHPKSPSGEPLASSSPPPTDAALSSDSSEVVDRSVSPLPRPEELTPDQAALTWQEDEITGHELDPAADDDGEGINGIGFKPTPAIAYARKQRRKEQVNEWKAREAKEARQKRFERRRAAGLDIAEEALAEERDAAAKRMVRFAGVG